MTQIFDFDRLDARLKEAARHNLGLSEQAPAIVGEVFPRGEGERALPPARPWP